MEENLKRNIVNKIFDMQETEICHNPYDHEQRKLFSIESGDLRQLRRCQKEKYEGRLGRVADEDLRNDKNIAIIVITLASRAAIRGGISPELAFTMADNYICDIERQKDKKVIAKKAEEYEEEFARQVMEAKKSPETNHYVEKAKDYIYKHLRFLYKGIIIKHNKTEPTYTKTSLFLCEKRRFFMGRTEKGGKVF